MSDLTDRCGPLMLRVPGAHLLRVSTEIAMASLPSREISVP
jgi:hypothetical protein